MAQVEIRKEPFPTADRACKAIFWPAPSFKKRTFDCDGFFAERTSISASKVNPPPFFFSFFSFLLPSLQTEGKIGKEPIPAAGKAIFWPAPGFKKRMLDCAGFFATRTSIFASIVTRTPQGWLLKLCPEFIVCGVIRVTICRVLSFSLLEDLSGWLHLFVSSPFNARWYVTTLKTVILGTFTVQISREKKKNGPIFVWRRFCFHSFIHVGYLI